MHIPDGYLSPSTCAALYVGAAPFWYVAAKRTNRLLHSRLMPRISLFAAFSFVLMMFNIPLPGGTTGHATGIGIATVVLGPWASMLSISVALAIQAIIFGDGGITAIGANCFNIAILGSLATWGVYKLLTVSAAAGSPRRVFAAGLAGYVGLNVAALATAIEFGIQPSLFRDANGAPLYAPYPLHIAIPAMMIGHLTIAGLAEFFVASGLTAFIQRTDPTLLGNATTTEPQQTSTRRLWMVLGILLMLTPLGILAAGTAWGEWGASDFADPEARKQIAAASLNAPLPVHPPQGLAKLSSIWTAPVPDYAPVFLKSESFGYMMSGIFGVGLVIFASQIVAWIVRRART
ncbi:MAG TPA: cobalt transporter CbiM [Bryobacteraceae bacterium]|nr:cobalt transporter CbiM [Bryobacteraceae bacterium]